MDNIIKHIETLLGRYDYAVVPGLGGFFIQQKNSSIQGETLLPPMATIGFSSLMSEPDAILTIEMTRAENISFRDAEQRLSQSVQQLKTTLLDQGRADVGRLGTLIMREGVMTFTPSSYLGFLPINYGLKPVHCTVMETHNEENDGRRVITIKLPTRRTVVRYAAVGLLLLGLSFSVPTITHYTKSEGAFRPLQQIKTYLTPHTAPTDADEVQLPPLTLPAPTPFVIQEPTTHRVSSVETPKDYHVVVATLQSERDANRMVKMYARDFDKIEVVGNGKWKRISAASFETEGRAYQYLREIKRDYPQFQDAWVYKKE